MVPTSTSRRGAATGAANTAANTAGNPDSTALSREAIVDHAHVMGLAGFVTQHFGYGRGACRFHRARANRGTGQLMPEGSFYLKCFREPFRAQPTHRAVALAMLMGVWQIANMSGFIFQALHDGRSKRKCASTLVDSALPPGSASHDST